VTALFKGSDVPNKVLPYQGRTFTGAQEQFWPDLLVSAVIAMYQEVRTAVTCITVPDKLYIVVMEAISCEFKTGLPFKQVYADDLDLTDDMEQQPDLKLTGGYMVWEGQV